MRNFKRTVCICITFLFTYIANAQTVQIIQPNGGEILYPCQFYDIEWTQTGTVSNYWNIDYSVDGGTIWASVTTNYLATNGRFTWQVPNVISNTVLVRVYDAQNPGTTDQSDAVFAIRKALTLTSPNGGEVLPGGTIHNITWNNHTGNSGSYTLYYSINNGSTWITIASNVAANLETYAWNVPVRAYTGNALVRVQYFARDCSQDVSDAVFTIMPPTPLLTAPNGGETLQLLCRKNITWDPATLYTTARIDYSTDNGTTWNLIINAASNDGSHEWAPSSDITPSDNCLVRISNTDYLTAFDVSNATFSIAKPISITVLNNEETVIGCNTVPISWAKTTCAGAWDIYYSLNNGSTWTFIAGPNDNGSATQTFPWLVPNGLNINTAKIRINARSYPTAIVDESDGNFSIIPSNDITVTSANGGESWQGLTTKTITWTNLPSASGQYNIQYSLNGTSWNTIATNITGNSYNWTLPNASSVNCKIRITDYNNTCKYDESDAAFTITPAVPILITPNGGQILQPFCNYNITWNTATLYTNARLDYSTDNGTTWTNIITGTSNDGSHNWNVPNITSATCLVRISNSGDLSVTDQSDATFSIVKPITVTVLNNGETVTGCSTVAISWTKTNCAGNWSIDYSINNGASYINIFSVADNGSLTQTTNWSVPNGINVSNAKIKISAVNSPAAIFDESDGNFSIIPSNDITVTSANGGESWQGLTTKTITWTNLPSASGQYLLQYSIDGGTNWNNIVSNITGNSYNWAVPNNPSGNCRIKVLDYTNPCKYDISDAVFSITPAMPVLISPNGGQTMQVFCTYAITWNTATLYTNARLDYSTDNGTTWVNITTSTVNDGGLNWNAPNILSSTCLIRISNAGNLALADTSDAPFSIATPVTVTAFNNAETVTGCNTVPITWTKTSCAGNWRIDYSINNGASYINIFSVTDNGSLTQTTNWSVPNGINVSNAKIKISAVNSPTAIVDESDGNFSIIPSNDITVTSANGGESWQGLTTKTITWTNLPSASGQYNIQYSLNGTSWNTIATNITGNSYNWTLPNASSVNCKIRITDYNNTCKYDESDAAFTITPAVPILITPNGGQILQPFCNYNITWNTATLYTNARLDYSTDNGTTWTNIITGTSNDGSHNWNVPNITSATCLVRISNSGDLSVTDQSDATFSIVKPITVTVLNNGETVTGCSTVAISWTKTNCAGNWSIDYSINNGASYINIFSVADNGSLTQTTNWSVPNGINVSNAKIKISAVNSPAAIFDESDGNFSIIPSNDITVTSANGGESWQGLTTKTITWTNLPSASGQYLLQYSIDGGTNWNNIVSNITGNSYNWAVPNNPSGNCRIKVLDYTNPCKYDISDAVFSITPAMPVLISPNGGQTMQVFCTYAITWNTATLYTNARLDYSTDNGTTWVNITTSTVNDGGLNWNAPNILSSTCLIRISNAGNLALADTSDAPFSIATPVTVTAFNNAETVTGCNTVPITWTKTSCAGNWRIDYSINNGASYINAGVVTNNGSTTQTFNWLVPNGINVTNAKIKVTAVNYPEITDESNGNFSILPSNDITLTSPNGGETWQGLTTKTITWTNLPTASGIYMLQYSTDGGTNWNNIVSNITGNSYIWTLPNTSSVNCKIKVLDYANTCKFDESNAYFTITPAVPILTAPNGGQVWYAGTGNGITWNPAYIYTSTVRLDYSIDNGTTWILISNGTFNDGEEYWVVPNANSSNCLVRISNFGDLSVTDQSDAVFTIKPAVTILTPNGNNQVNIGGCTTTSITFDHSPVWTNYYIEYTLNNGATWNLIHNNYPVTSNPFTLNWNVPNVSSTQARIRIRPTANSYTDISDDVFSIIKSVAIVQPNFGGIMQAGTNYDIQWSSEGISSVYDIFYSTDGTTYTNIVTGYNTSNNKYSWTVPNIPSSNCRIMIRDNINTCKTDTSDMAFIISTTAAPITMVTPNGIADTLSACAPYTISWTETSAIGTYNIDYSLNSGATWINIVSNYSTNSNSYNWAIPPGLASNTVLLRISAAANAGIYDLSNAFFVITQPTYTFTGNGNWSETSNWANNQPPPANPPACTQIVIDNQVNGECILDVPYNLPAGATLTVKEGKKLTIPGNLNIE
jgi:hypothetical protein